MNSLTSYKKLVEKKGRIESGLFIVEGLRSINQIMVKSPEKIVELIVRDDHDCNIERYPVRRVSAKQYNSISAMKTPQGVMALVRVPMETYSSTLPEPAGSNVLFLEDVQDPGNVGTLIRTAAAFGFSGIFLSEGCADPFSPKCVQASAGSILSLWIRKTGSWLSVLQGLQGRGFSVAASDVSGREDPSLIRGKKSVVVALGNEGRGLSGSVLKSADYRIRIPVHTDRAESINVAVCGGIIMYLVSEHED